MPHGAVSPTQANAKGALPRVVHYVPTLSNQIMVEKLRTLAPLNEVTFIPLQLLGHRADRPEIFSHLFGPDRSDETLEDLHLLKAKVIANLRRSLPKGRATLIWGDGNQHHFSYYFDWPSNGVPVFKVNLDGHLDFAKDHQNLVSGVPDYNDHVSHSGARSNYVAASLILSLGGTLSFTTGKTFSANQLKFSKNQHIHISTDFDAVTLFPAYCTWVTWNGFTISQIVEQVQAAKDTGELKRLDFGGLINRIPNFDIVPNYQYVVDRLDVTTAVMLTYGKIFDPRHKLIADAILTHALMCYYKILKAALFD